METAPKIELKNIKHTAWASEETYCYQATLYVDGERWGTVSNQGRGGPDAFHGENGIGYEDIRLLNIRIKNTMPVVPCEGYSLTPDLELISHEAVTDWLRDKDFNRAMKSKVLFTKPDAQGIWGVLVKKPMTRGMVLDSMKAQHPQYTYLADLPADKAKQLYFA
jgi:hypothetical protein